MHLYEAAPAERGARQRRMIGHGRRYTRAMSSLRRLLLVWLIAIALPAQGVAAATLQFCGPGHESQLRLLEASARDRHGDHHHATEHSGAGAAQGAAGDLAPHGKLNCSACAACCAATALPASPLSVPAIEPAVERVAPILSTYVGPVGAGLERPPKLHLA